MRDAAVLQGRLLSRPCRIHPSEANDDAAAALTLKLGADDVAQLEAPYQPHPVVGFE